jgi:hypothetical protein
MRNTDLIQASSSAQAALGRKAGGERYGVDVAVSRPARRRLVGGFEPEVLQRFRERQEAAEPPTSTRSASGATACSPSANPSSRNARRRFAGSSRGLRRTTASVLSVASDSTRVLTPMISRARADRSSSTCWAPTRMPTTPSAFTPLTLRRVLSAKHASRTANSIPRRCPKRRGSASRTASPRPVPDGGDLGIDLSLFEDGGLFFAISLRESPLRSTTVSRL